MTEAGKPQEDEEWGIFLQWCCNYSSTHSFNRNLKTYYGPGTFVVCTCVGGCIDQLLDTGRPQPNLAHKHLVFPQNVDQQYFFISTLMCNLLTLN